MKLRNLLDDIMRLLSGNVITWNLKKYHFPLLKQKVSLRIKRNTIGVSDKGKNTLLKAWTSRVLERARLGVVI